MTPPRVPHRLGSLADSKVGSGLVLVLAALLQLVALSVLHGAPVAYASSAHLGGHHAHHHHGDAQHHGAPPAAVETSTAPDLAAGDLAAADLAAADEAPTGSAAFATSPSTTDEASGAAVTDVPDGEHQHEPHQHVDLEPTADAAAVRSATFGAGRVRVTAPVMTPAPVLDGSSRPD